MNDIETSTNSKLVEYLDRRGIEAFGFDIDNTLVHTREYYDIAMYRIGCELAPMIDNSRDPGQISKEINDAIFLAYEKDGKKPRLIDGRYITGLKEYLGTDASEEMQQYVIDFFKDFYNKSPVPFSTSADVLKTLIDLDKKIVLHSHAQEDWTKIKADIFELEIGTSLPYLSTPLGATKDSRSWLKAFDIIDVDISKSLVIGDNFEADIRPCLDVGCKNLVWINRYDAKLPEDLNLEDDVELIVIEDIGELIETLSIRA